MSLMSIVVRLSIVGTVGRLSALTLMLVRIRVAQQFLVVVLCLVLQMVKLSLAAVQRVVRVLTPVLMARGVRIQILVTVGVIVLVALLRIRAIVVMVPPFLMGPAINGIAPIVIPVLRAVVVLAIVVGRYATIKVIHASRKSVNSVLVGIGKIMKKEQIPTEILTMIGIVFLVMKECIAPPVHQVIQVFVEVPTLLLLVVVIILIMVRVMSLIVPVGVRLAQLHGLAVVVG